MKRGVALPHDFSSRVKAAVKLVRKHTYVRIISHYDADGITAAAIMASALRRSGIEFLASIVKSLDGKMIEKLSTEHDECLIFLDMGSGQIEGIERMNSDIVILDHHKPVKDTEKVIQVNPHFFGIDGMHDVSASGLSFAFATTMSEKNWANAHLAITGIIGDMQNLGGYSAINSSIINGAVERGLIVRSDGLRLSGSSILEMLQGSFMPYFRGLSGRKEASEEFLQSANVDPSMEFGSIDENSSRRLLSLLTLKLLGQGCGNDAIDMLWGETMHLKENDFGALKIDDLVDLVNASGRTDHYGIGVSLCLGDADAFQQAKKYRAEYSSSLLAELRRIEDGAFENRKHIQIIRPMKPSLAGATCGISMQFLLDQAKPTIALCRVDGAVKVSSRGTRDLVSKGLDLSESLRKCAEMLGGVGGGHAVAAGATVPMAREKEFIEILDEHTGKQLTRATSDS